MRYKESSNPALKIARKVQGTGQASFEGVLNKAMLSIFLLILGASFTWIQFINGSNELLFYMGFGLIGAFIAAIITSFIPSIATVTVPIYSVLEGLFLGGISAQYSSLYNGIVMQAVLITIGILLVMILLYRLKVIRATGSFRKGIFAATLGVGLTYLFTFVLSLFGITVPYIHSSGPIGIVISLGIIVIAALNFIVDFDNIEEIVNYGAPKKMEWIGVMGILLTLVWLYLEVLRLLAKIKD